MLGSTDIHRQSEIVLGACGGQRCLAGDGSFHSSEMPAAKVILLFLPLLNLKAADVKTGIMPQPWPVTASRTPHFCASIFKPSFPAALVTCVGKCVILGCVTQRGGRGATQRFSPLGMTKVLGKYVQIYYIQRGNALQEHFCKAATSLQKLARHRWSSPHWAQQVLPLPGACLVRGQQWLEWGCLEALLGLPASLRGHSELRCLGSTSTACLCLAVHSLPTSPGTCRTTRSSPGYPNPAWGRLFSPALWSLPLPKRPCAFLPSPGGRSSCAAAAAAPPAPWAQEGSQGKEPLASQPSSGSLQAEVGAFQLSLEKWEGPTINVQGRMWMEMSGGRSGEEVWRLRFSPTL